MNEQQLRKLKMIKATQKIMDKRIEENCPLLFKLWPQQKANLLQNINQMFEDIVKFQSEKVDYSIMFFQCSLLRSSFITESFQYLVSAFDKDYYLDESAFHIVWDAHPFFQFLSEDIRAISSQLSNIFPRLQEYELKDLRYRVCYYYDVIVGTLFSAIIPDILLMPAFKEINKTEDFCILLSGWLDESAKLYPLNIEGGQV